MLQSIKQFVLRPKAIFFVGENVAVAKDFTAFLGSRVKVTEVTYHPFGIDGTFFKPEPPEYTYSVQRWDGFIYAFFPECSFLKRV